ncbi:CoA transferase [uncultured Corynebacterium sp.]|uniref:CoA transferase n=1 Tax=uncultured Corynebacterium sp. TaxID=159447 RepID=UPI0025FD69B0|nr:CoA transferase [uncultured Corynebacterium sp.]
MAEQFDDKTTATSAEEGTGQGLAFTVVSLAPNLPGPLAARCLAELGGDVTKVEAPSGDPMALYCPQYYEGLTESQSVVSLNLKDPMGMTALQDLLVDADILLTSHRPAALERMGLGWEDLHARFPRLSQVAIVGHSGEDADVAGHDLTYQADAGTLSRDEEGRPLMPRIPVADMAGSERAVAEAMAALYEAQITDQGTYREVSLAGMAEVFGEPARYGLMTKGLLGGSLPQYAMYEAASGWVAVALLEPHFLEGFTRAVVADELAEDGLVDCTAESFAGLFATKPAQWWEAWARKNGLPITAVKG